MSTEICALSIFARPVVAGVTKTRLSPVLGPEGSATLYRAFVADTLATVGGLPELAPTLWVAGDPEHATLGAYGLPREAQPELDLGARIRRALEHGLSRHRCALACGTDAPTLPASHLRRAARALEHAEVVLGPSADGGYYLIGLRRPAGALPDLFSRVRWSTRHTLADTLALTACAGLSVAMLPPWYDVDEPADLELLRMHLALDPGVAPATRAALTTLV
ncbi:MAG: TIGR04282 family arsenosugar biosynthesis glycosyltransferase [Myxococcales bacterium]|nr:TIGR04282 family arsenosugar biosynthesis glycosyltransferase [Myxococcales bacterium]